jgi:putative membrane protein
MKRIDLSRGFLSMTLGLATVLGGTIAAKADLPEAPGDVPRSALAPTDYKVVKCLHAMNDLDISAGELAAKKGSTQAVRDFGATLVSDHTMEDQRLLAYAKNAGIDPKRMKGEPPAYPMKQYLQNVDRLRTLTGPQFDHEFAVTMRDAAAQTIATIQTASPSISDSNLTALLDKRLPSLNRNYGTAANLAAQQEPSPSDQSQRPAPGTTR